MIDMTNKQTKTKQLKPLLPSLRQKKRYVVFDVLSEKAIKSVQPIQKAIWETSLSFLGEQKMGKAGLFVLPQYYDKKQQRGILRVSNKQLHDMKSALTLVQSIDNQPVIIKTVGVSGILKKAIKNYNIMNNAKAS